MSNTLRLNFVTSFRGGDGKWQWSAEGLAGATSTFRCWKCPLPTDEWNKGLLKHDCMRGGIETAKVHLENVFKVLCSLYDHKARGVKLAVTNMRQLLSALSYPTGVRTFPAHLSEDGTTFEQLVIHTARLMFPAVEESQLLSLRHEHDAVVRERFSECLTLHGILLKDEPVPRLSRPFTVDPAHRDTAEVQLVTLDHPIGAVGKSTLLDFITLGFSGMRQVIVIFNILLTTFRFFEFNSGGSRVGLTQLGAPHRSILKRR